MRSAANDHVRAGINSPAVHDLVVGRRLILDAVGPMVAEVVIVERNDDDVIVPLGQHDIILHGFHVVLQG